MADTPTLTLVCLVEGTSKLFEVSPTRDMVVMDLRNLIKENGKGVLDNVGAADLILWKVDLPLPLRHQQVPIVEYEDSPNSIMLEPVDEISTFWPATFDPKRIHVVVVVPSAQVQTLPTSVTPTSVVSGPIPDVNDSDLLWLREVHSKIWNREDRRSQIFRTVELTREIFDELQRRLAERRPDRDTPEYRGHNRDVRGVKLDFLLSLPPANLSSRHSDDNDSLVGNDGIANVDDAVLESLFPTLLRFLDLSTLNLTEKVSGRLPLPLLLREEYDNISGLIKRLPFDNGGSVIISGQPGTGKTAYIFLRMIENMIEGHPFLYQNNSRVVYHVAEKGIEVIRSSWSPKEPIVAFVDGDKENFEPRRVLDHCNIQLVVASYPKGSSEKWIEQMGNDSIVTRIATKLWSREELLLTGLFLHKFDLRFNLLMESTAHFGYNPRQCFRIPSTGLLANAKKEVAYVAYISGTQDKFRKIIELIHGALTGNLEVSHRFFQISPHPSDSEQLFASCVVDCVSPWAWELLLDQYNIHTADDIATFYRKVTARPDAGSLFADHSQKDESQQVQIMSVGNP